MGMPRCSGSCSTGSRFPRSITSILIINITDRRAKMSSTTSPATPRPLPRIDAARDRQSRSQTPQRIIGASCLDIWDYLVAAGIGLLVLLTTFASGGVDVWATGRAEALCFSLALLWLGKSFLSARGRGGFPTLARREFRALAIAAGAFLG